MRALVSLILLVTAAAAQVRLPAHTRHSTSNGLTITLAPNRELPLITLRVMARGGIEADPPRAAGVSALTLDLLRRGTSEPGVMSATAFATALDHLGAEWRAQVDSQAASITVEFLSKDTPRALELLSAALLRPAFDAGEFKKAVGEFTDAARAVKDDPRRLVGLYFRPFFFGEGHPYGRPERGDETSLATITRDAVVAQHKKLFTARNLHIVAAGDFDSKAFLPVLEQSFRGLPEGPAHAWIRSPAPVHAQSRLLLVDKPDATQTYFWIGQPGIHRTHPDRTVLELVNTLFGGRFTSMLNDELRVNTGLSYGASSRLQMDRLPGATVISSFTQTATTRRAIDLAVEVLTRFREKGITQDQLDSAKAYVKGTFPPAALETTGQIAQLLADLELHGLRRGEIDDYFSRIDAVTLAQANAAIRKHYAADRLQFCLVGAAGKIEDEVRGLAREVRVGPATAPGIRVPR